MKRFMRVGLLLTALTMVLGVALPAAALAATGQVAVAQEAPAETSPPAETTPPTDAGGDETPWWVLLIVLGGLFILIIALLAGRRKKPASTGAVPAWRTHARSGYAESRWVSDNMTETLAIWHGDADQADPGAATATDAANAKTWDEVPGRMQRATAELYALEAAAGPGSQGLKASQQTTAALKDAHAAFVERSDARAAYRAAAESTDPAGDSLTAARDREVRASGKLTAARQQLAAALTMLKPIA